MKPILTIAFLIAVTSPAAAQDPTSAQLSSSQNPSSAGRPVTLTATVDGLSGGEPTGVVRFTEDGTAIGSRSPIAPGAGQATLTAGNYHTCGLASLGALKCWGYNESGQLGDGTTTDKSTPASVYRFETKGAVAVAAGSAMGRRRTA